MAADQHASVHPAGLKVCASVVPHAALAALFPLAHCLVGAEGPAAEGGWACVDVHDLDAAALGSSCRDIVDVRVHGMLQLCERRAV